MPFDLIKAGATQTETSLLKQHAAGEPVDLLDDYDFPARTITEKEEVCSQKTSVCKVWAGVREITSLPEENHSGMTPSKCFFFFH